MNDDVENAFRLYEWNMRASACIMTVTSMAEVIVRNSLDRQLSDWAARRKSAENWFDLDVLDPRGRQDLEKARRRAAGRKGGSEKHGKVIAELSLGFWRYLVESRYFTALWVPAAHAAFPHGPTDLRARGKWVGSTNDLSEVLLSRPTVPERRPPPFPHEPSP